MAYPDCSKSLQTKDNSNVLRVSPLKGLHVHLHVRQAIKRAACCLSVRLIFQINEQLTFRIQSYKINTTMDAINIDPKTMANIIENILGRLIDNGVLEDHVNQIVDSIVMKHIYFFVVFFSCFFVILTLCIICGVGVAHWIAAYCSRCYGRKQVHVQYTREEE